MDVDGALRVLIIARSAAEGFFVVARQVRLDDYAGPRLQKKKWPRHSGNFWDKSRNRSVVNLHWVERAQNFRWGVNTITPLVAECPTVITRGILRPRMAAASRAKPDLRPDYAPSRDKKFHTERGTSESVNLVASRGVCSFSPFKSLCIDPIATLACWRVVGAARRPEGQALWT